MQLLMRDFCNCSSFFCGISTVDRKWRCFLKQFRSHKHVGANREGKEKSIFIHIESTLLSVWNYRWSYEKLYRYDDSLYVLIISSSQITALHLYSHPFTWTTCMKHIPVYRYTWWGFSVFLCSVDTLGDSIKNYGVQDSVVSFSSTLTAPAPPPETTLRLPKVGLTQSKSTYWFSLI